jgi:acyl-coenzyme A thioesterase PaaI-like protein
MVYAEAQVVRKGRQIAFTEGCIRDVEDAIFSKTAASFAIFHGGDQDDRGLGGPEAEEG